MHETPGPVFTLLFGLGLFFFFFFLFFVLSVTNYSFIGRLRPIKLKNKTKSAFPFYYQIYSFVLQGRVNDARELLAQHPDRHPGEYDVCDVLAEIIHL